ncbi:SDR family NAD(P)-dependent oxidoreductase [Oenococcus oeni]|uniref:SDR family NAD(P)-dependent oxidoreductase n=1 Tax=Oenococcus oeni TaxID=1247 RepID=UPI0010B42B8B|nr:glucose 1-dehydrogenase [Oenococcus oeni]SYW19606.1 putative 3-oxoacyl-(acyl-carrier-protein) reductase (fabG) [Oenococcus oeni]
MTKQLEGKIAIVTGAASGMGKSITELFTREGAKVIAADRDNKVSEIWDSDQNAIPIIADITDSKDINRIVETAKEKFGGLDAVLNVAGINDLNYPLLDTDDERWNKVMDIDLKAPFRLIRRALPIMIENGGGSIVNIGSYAALRGNHGPSYTAAKAGLVGLTRSIAFTYGRSGIRCNIVHPGGVDTNISDNSGTNYHSEGQKSLSAIIQAMPVKYFAKPTEIANICLFLCSDKATWVNGAAISVDGGMSTC